MDNQFKVGDIVVMVDGPSKYYKIVTSIFGDQCFGKWTVNVNDLHNKTNYYCSFNCKDLKLVRGGANNKFAIRCLDNAIKDII